MSTGGPALLEPRSGLAPLRRVWPRHVDAAKSTKRIRPSISSVHIFGGYHPPVLHGAPPGLPGFADSQLQPPRPSSPLIIGRLIKLRLPTRDGSSGRSWHSCDRSQFSKYTKYTKYIIYINMNYGNLIYIYVYFIFWFFRKITFLDL